MGCYRNSKVPIAISAVKSAVMKKKELLSLKISCKAPQITEGDYQFDLDQSDFTDNTLV